MTSSAGPAAGALGIAEPVRRVPASPAAGVDRGAILLADVGQAALLAALAVSCVVALGVTAALRIEPRGESLDEVSGRDAAALKARPTPP